MAGQTVADIEAYGVDRWLGELARDLKEGTDRPDAVRQVLIPKRRVKGVLTSFTNLCSAGR